MTASDPRVGEIQADAIEAAAKEFAAVADPLGDWEKQAESYHGIYRRRAQRILEAAAPHMLAEAWDEGHRTCRLDADSIGFNPYRTTK